MAILRKTHLPEIPSILDGNWHPAETAVPVIEVDKPTLLLVSEEVEGPDSPRGKRESSNWSEVEFTADTLESRGEKGRAFISFGTIALKGEKYKVQLVAAGSDTYLRETDGLEEAA
jgi:hypothetical protein